MTASKQITTEPDQTQPAKRKGRLRKIIGLAAFLTAAIWLLAVFAYFASIHRFVRREIVRLQRDRDQLQALVDRLDAGAKQADGDRRIVLYMLEQCRSAEDIPDLPGGRIVSKIRAFDSVRIYVPAGSHTLEIESKWHPRASAADEANSSDDGPAGEQTWQIPLLPSSGYLLAVKSDRKGGPLGWELTSNHADFESQTGTLPLDDFSHSGSSYSVKSVCQFPNQVSYLVAQDLHLLAKKYSSVQLLEATLTGRRQERSYEVKFKVRARSDGPLCIAASDAPRALIMDLQDLLLPYEGSGKYLLRLPESDGG